MCLNEQLQGLFVETLFNLLKPKLSFQSENNYNKQEMLKEKRNLLRILFIGDVVGSLGREALATYVPKLKKNIVHK